MPAVASKARRVLFGGPSPGEARKDLNKALAEQARKAAEFSKQIHILDSEDRAYCPLSGNVLENGRLSALVPILDSGDSTEIGPVVSEGEGSDSSETAPLKFHPISGTSRITLSSFYKPKKSKRSAKEESLDEVLPPAVEKKVKSS